ncbi:hypothetical protein POSPLADRAFT_1049294 [Postia placenta MAD-698-R-SB12]|uniref:F-box domain-containing protein n=1 Tax=Postia placenta MAD-698-R-SB12 TaxID=670580 RepID=A0A1X6MQ92_9APHY|nr:hypothetical protein POSPLADRAFT_1049294 [Postia placenta MAD-698-R-SB12]OSX58460.1 hypothetical protein POSPLADRAFT_1049294 [Postia placenta MAD-698-R-SB12]
MSASDIKGGWADDVPVGLHTCVVIVKYADTHSEFDWRGRHTGPLYHNAAAVTSNSTRIGLLIPGTERVEIFDIFDIQRWYLFSLISRVSCKVDVMTAREGGVSLAGHKTFATRIPSEILANVLEEGFRDSNCFARMRFVLRAASVSHAWRATALNISALWGTIVITRPRAPPIAVLGLLLDRSRHSQLDVFVDWFHAGSRRPNAQWEDDPTYINLMMEMLRQHVKRWRSIDLTWNLPRSNERDHTFEPLLTGSADALRSLRLSCVCDAVYQDNVSWCDFTRGLSAPNLRSIDLDIPSGDDMTLSAVTARFSSIRELRWRESSRQRWFYDSMDFMRMLEPLKNLQHLTLDNFYIESISLDPPGGDEALICLPALKALTFCDTDLETIGEVLFALTAPNLRDLIIHNLVHDDETASFHASWKQPKSLPLLHTLYLEFNVDGLNIDELIELWRHFQFFRSARIIHTFARNSNDFSMDDVLEALSHAQDDGGWLFSHLTSLAIYSKSDMATDGLRRLVENRRETGIEVPNVGVMGLQTLKIYAPEIIDSTDSDYFGQNLRHFDWIKGKPPPGCDKQHLSMADWALQLPLGRTIEKCELHVEGDLEFGSLEAA